MTTSTPQEADWGGDERQPPANDATDSFIVDVEGFEGPLDLLLAMARTQKVDISRLSVLALAEQYLAFIAEAQRLRLELAADYLVMAAWLAFLKSRLLLPKETDEDDAPSGEELAQRLAFRLARLEAMRSAAQRLMQRKRLGQDVFARGMPEHVKSIRETTYTAELFDLLKAYADRRVKRIPRQHVVRKRTVWSIKDARVRLERMLAEASGEWVQLDLFLDHVLATNSPVEGEAITAQQRAETTRTIVASSFGAALELARDGVLDLRQSRAFGPLQLRGHPARERESRS